MANNQASTNPPHADEFSAEVASFTLPHTIVLTIPIQWEKEESPRDTLTINRRLKAKDFKGIKASDIRFDDMMKLISKVSGESVSFIEELDAADLLKASEVVQSFLPSGLTTGDNR